MQTVQLNVRMERSLRDAGNAALESKGVSPSAFVRAVWEKLAQKGESLEEALNLYLRSQSGAKAQLPDVGPIEQGQSLYARLLHDVGVESVNIPDAFWAETYDQTCERAVMEHWYEKGLDHV